MTRIELEIHDDVVTTINKIKNINDAGVDVEIPEGSVLFENILNLKLIKSFAEKIDISVHFQTEDVVGNNLISMLNGNGGSADFVGDIGGEGKRKLSIPKVKLSGLSLPKLSFSFKGKPVIFILFLILGAYAYYHAGSNIPNAEAKIIVDYSHLTRSLTIKVISYGPTEPENKTLNGSTVSVTVADTAETETTGEKLVGEKAKGEVTIYNNTDEEEEFEKGLILKGEDDREYILDDTVTVPARTQLAPDPLDPSIISYQKGEANADILANEIGKEYNLDSGEELELDDYDSSEFNAFTATDIEGGSSETVKVVAEEDKETLSTTLSEELKNKASADLKKQQGGQKFIEGSTIVNITEESFSHEVDGETDVLTLTQTATAEGLAYNEKDLNNIIDKLVEDLVPDGFELSNKEREINVEILGESTNSVLSSKEADIQVTLKAFVVPIIDEGDLVQKIKGKSPQEAQKVLGSIKNVKTYELNIAPSIPLFQKVPDDENRIKIEVERE